MSDAAIGRYLSIDDVVAETSLSRATLYRLVKRGKFPDRIRISENRVAWSENAVQAWKTERVTKPPI